ncbi:MAG: ABC transporter ATP-binding protein, partial [Clostridia bacterium]|nr:ABC transporter ATP-binding protein [Clostridia bacterium]
MKKKQKLDFKTIRRVLRDLKQYRVMLLFSLLFAAFNVALTLYIPLLTGNAIDLMLGKGMVDWDGVVTIAI